MSTKPTSEQEASESIDEKRAQYEQFEFDVRHDREHVNVRNETYDEPGHVYSVRIENGDVVACSCLHHQHRDIRCKHIRAVAAEEIVLAAVDAAGTDQDQEQEVAPDGGVELPAITEHIEPADQGGEKYVRCEGCGREILSKLGGRRKLTHADDCPHAHTRE